MIQTLFHIPNEIGGVPLFGSGLLLALWAVGSVAFLLWLGRRQGWNNDTWGYVPLFLVIGAAIYWVLPALCDAQGLPIRGYGVMLLVAVASAVGLAAWRARRVGLDPDLIYNLAFWLFVPGLIGARLFYVIQKWPTEFEAIYQIQGFWAVLGTAVNVAQGGLVVYGSFIGGTLGAVAFIAKYRLPPLAMLDLITPSLALGLAIGRLGCLMNGCCFGGPCDLPWALTFPVGSPPHVHQFIHGELPLYGLKLADDAARLPRIEQIEPDSPAAKAGLAADTWIDEIGQVPVLTSQDVYWVLVSPNEGGTLPIQTVRGRQHAWTAGADGAAWPLGLKLVGGPGDVPILAEVASGSKAEQEGLKAGQEVFAIGGRRVRNVAAAQRMLAQSAQPGQSVSIVTVDDRSTSTMSIAGPPAASRPVHPTQLYSAINAALLCLFLLAYDPFRRRDGELWALFLTIYPITRFLLEIIRTDEPGVFGTGMSISQNVSLVLLVCAVALWVAILLKPAGVTFSHADPLPAGKKAA